MQMTEPFATTVAAVAPVIWLAGAVEAHQVAKYVRELAEARRSWAEGLATELEGLDDASIVARPSTDRGMGAAWVYLGLFAVWIALSAALIVATTRSLRWLSESERAPEPALARFCFETISYGMLTVTLLPGIVMAVRMMRSESRTTASLRAVKQRRAEAEARLAAQASGEDDRAGART